MADVLHEPHPDTDLPGTGLQALMTGLLENTHDAVIFIDMQGKITYWNPVAEQLFGYAAAEAVGQTTRLLTPADRAAEERYILGQMLQGKRIVQQETSWIASDGRAIAVSLNVSPMYTAGRIIIGGMILARNISDRLLASEQKAILAAIVGTSDDAIISKTLQGTITSWNLSAERMFGYTAAEAVGKHISLIIPKDRLGEEDFIIGQIAKGRKVDHFETLRRTKDGRKIHISVTVSPVIDASGKIIGASKVARDITVSKQFAEKQGMLAAIISSSDDTIVSKTLEGIITSWNRAAERMFGYTEAEALGKHISLIIPPDRLGEEAYIIGKVSKGKRVDHFETIRMAKDGRAIPISLSVSPIIDSNGKIIGASKIARDISEQVAAREERARLYDEIKALNDKKDEFIGLASHELKTPLTSVQGYLQILQQDMSDERRKDFLKKAAQQVRKVNGLVSDLLDISKIQSGQLQFNFATFDLVQLTRDALDLMATANPQYHLYLESGEAAVRVNGDAQRIEQVILNLLTNAIRYSKDSRDVVIQLTSDGQVATVAVKDQGIGIAAGQLEQIFDRFYRIGENKNISGLGLGLYLSRQIIARHNGRIWAESSPGEGSVFYFTLPIENVL